MSNVLDRLTITASELVLTFRKTPQISTLKNASFKLFLITESDPDPEDPDKDSWNAEEISNPFQSIVLSNDYNSLARRLVLRFHSPPLTTGWYRFVIDGVKDAAGNPMGVESFHFEYEFETTGPQGPDDVIVHVQDFSIKKRAFISSETIIAANPHFFITNTNPENHSVFLEEDYNNGRVIVEFSRRPNLAYVNNKYIKVQRKKIGALGARWEKLTAKFKLDSSSPRIFIYIPSLDDPPVYDAPDHVYFEEGYKYRIRLLADIAPQSEEGLG